MRRALELSLRGRGQVSPNPMVGAVLVRDGEVVGEGWHAMLGGAHAETAALASAGERARGATLYVTLEPCVHHGRTPPCVDAIIAAGVARVVCAITDPTPEAAGGVARLREAGVEAACGLLAEDAAELNAAFLHGARSALPWVTLKLALSLDGAIADHTGRPAWLTGPRARQRVHEMRAANDGIAVGAGTALADDPQLTVRDTQRPRVAPARVIFDRQLTLPLESSLVRTARTVPVVVVADNSSDSARRRALEGQGVAVVLADSHGDALRALRARGIGSLLVEGGARIAGSLLDAALVHRLVIFQAPVVLGAGALGGFAHVASRVADDAPRWRVVGRESLDDDLMTVYALQELDVHRPD